MNVEPRDSRDETADKSVVAYFVGGRNSSENDTAESKFIRPKIEYSAASNGGRLRGVRSRLKDAVTTG